MKWIDLVEVPARFLGELIGPFFHLFFLLGGAAAGVFLGRIVFAYVRLPVINWIAAVFLGLWVFVVLGSAGKYTAAAWIHASEGRDDY